MGHQIVEEGYTDETVLSLLTLTRISNVRFLVQAVSYSERAGSGG